MILCLGHSEKRGEAEKKGLGTRHSTQRGNRAVEAQAQSDLANQFPRLPPSQPAQQKTSFLQCSLPFFIAHSKWAPLVAVNLNFKTHFKCVWRVEQIKQ